LLAIIKYAITVSHMISQPIRIIDANYQQAYASNCCGAYSLTTILDAFGVFDISYKGIHLNSGESIPISYNGRTSFISKNIYLKGIANEFYRITGDPSFNCQNLPDSLVYIAANILGLDKYDISINITEESYNQIIQVFPTYRTLVEKCKQILGTQNVNTNANIFDYRTPEGNWCQHLVVRINSEYDYGDLHWLARDGRGLFYDSICGYSGYNWANLTIYDATKKEFPQTKTEASIVMSDTLHCNMPVQKVLMDYQWIGFWIDYKEKGF
jgi:hypothetical protein